MGIQLQIVRKKSCCNNFCRQAQHFLPHRNLIRNHYNNQETAFIMAFVSVKSYLFPSLFFSVFIQLLVIRIYQHKPLHLQVKNDKCLCSRWYQLPLINVNCMSNLVGHNVARLLFGFIALCKQVSVLGQRSLVQDNPPLCNITVQCSVYVVPVTLAEWDVFCHAKFSINVRFLNQGPQYLDRLVKNTVCCVTLSRPQLLFRCVEYIFK